MQPTSKTESYWRTFGIECRKFWKQGAGAARTSRRLTRKQSNKAMRTEGKQAVSDYLTGEDREYIVETFKG